jgi:CRISPR-associated protein Cas6
MRRRGQVNNRYPEMSDLAFGLQGTSVPAGYAFALWREVARCLPWLGEDGHAGILPLRAAASGSALLLPQRAKLVLRVKSELVPRAMALAGSKLDVGGSLLQVGEAEVRPLKPHPTLHAQLVESGCGEGVFLEEMGALLEEMEIACRMICGKPQVLEDASQRVAGYSLVLHDLKPSGSLRILQAGLGGKRRYGCGIFVPHKTISGLN